MTTEETDAYHKIILAIVHNTKYAEKHTDHEMARVGGSPAVEIARRVLVCVENNTIYIYRREHTAYDSSFKISLSDPEMLQKTKKIIDDFLIIPLGHTPGRQ